MKNLLRPMLIAAAFLALASIVQASIRSRARPRVAAPAFAISGSLRGTSCGPACRSGWTSRAGEPHTRDAVDHRPAGPIGGRRRPPGSRLLCRARLHHRTTARRVHSRSCCPRGARSGPAGQRPSCGTPPKAGHWAPLGPPRCRQSRCRTFAQTNQDACKGAALQLMFTGTARRARARRVRPR